MARLTVFDSITIDGFFTGKDGDLSWAHGFGGDDPEWTAFVQGNSRGGGTLVFGRVTYDMMVSYWPTEKAKQQNPVVAAQMHQSSKVVFSKSLSTVDWNNTRLVKGNVEEELRRLKEAPGSNLVILGSGTIVSQAAKAGLVDQYTLVVVPVAIGQGRSLFEGLEKDRRMTLTGSRAFRNGNIVLTYEPQ